MLTYSKHAERRGRWILYPSRDDVFRGRLHLYTRSVPNPHEDNESVQAIIGFSGDIEIDRTAFQTVLDHMKAMRWHCRPASCICRE